MIIALAHGKMMRKQLNNSKIHVIHILEVFY